MYEAQWTMPLPSGLLPPAAASRHPRRDHGRPVPGRSPLILSEPTVGTGLDDPWQFVAAGIGRDVEGENSFYAADGSGNATTVPTTAVDQAITDGWRIAGRDASVTSTSPTALATSENLNTVGALLTAAAQAAGKRWGVKNDNLLYFMSDPTTPSYQVTPGAAALGVADDDYASTVKVRYLDSSTGTYLTRTATNARPPPVRGPAVHGRHHRPGRGPSTAAQNIADQILGAAQGAARVDQRADRHQQRAADDGRCPGEPVEGSRGRGDGCMVRLHGIYNDLLAYNGQTWLTSSSVRPSTPTAPDHRPEPDRPGAA
jgi:hypothetical protein